MSINDISSRMRIAKFLTIPNTLRMQISSMHTRIIIVQTTSALSFDALRNRDFSLIQTELIQWGSTMSSRRKLDPAPQSYRQLTGCILDYFSEILMATAWLRSLSNVILSVSSKVQTYAHSSRDGLYLFLVFLLFFGILSSTLFLSDGIWLLWMV